MSMFLGLVLSYACVEWCRRVRQMFRDECRGSQLTLGRFKLQ